MLQTQDMTPHPSQYTVTGPTYCAIHCCGTSDWNTQLPILMFWVRPDREILPRPSTDASERSTMMLLWWQWVRCSIERTIPIEPWTCGVEIHYSVTLAHGCFCMSSVVLVVLLLGHSQAFSWYENILIFNFLFFGGGGGLGNIIASTDLLMWYNIHYFGLGLYAYSTSIFPVGNSQLRTGLACRLGTNQKFGCVAPSLSSTVCVLRSDW